MTHPDSEHNSPAASRILLEISYDGSEYSGWQLQPHCLTVQQVLQDTLSRLFAGAPIHLQGSSRTDAGVHALGFSASFVAPPSPYISIEQLSKALNRLLPRSVRIRSVGQAPLEFNARHDAKGKAYTYVLNLGPETPFTARYSWLMRRPLDIENMRAAANYLTGTHDFSSFVVERKTIPDAVRTIYRIDFDQFGQFLCITFVGNGFLYKMIRCLMGLLEVVGRGLLEPAEAARILAAKDRVAAPETAPPHGLFLMKVFYDEDAMRRFKLTRLPFS